MIIDRLLIVIIIIIIITKIIIAITINNNNNNNTDNFPETRKCWIDVKRGIVSSHGERDPL